MFISYVSMDLHKHIHITLFIHSFESSWYHDCRTLETINMSLKGIIFPVYSK